MVLWDGCASCWNVFVIFAYTVFKLCCYENHRNKMLRMEAGNENSIF